jgi:hypothetical protein
MSVMSFFEGIPQIREGKSADGRSHLQNGRRRDKYRQQHGDANKQ